MLERVLGLLVTLWFLSVFASVIYLWVKWWQFKMRKRLERLPTSKTRAAAAGRCELQGIAWPSTAILVNPFTNARVVYLNLAVFSSTGQGPLVIVERLAPFFIVDETGMAIVKDVKSIETYRLASIPVTGSETEPNTRDRIISALEESKILYKYKIADLKFWTSEIKQSDFIFAIGEFTKSSRLELDRHKPEPGLMEFFDGARKKYFLQRARPVVNSMRNIWNFFASSSGHVPRIETLECHGKLQAPQNEKLFLSNRVEAELLAEFGDSIYIRFVVGFAILLFLISPFLIGLALSR